MSASLTILVGDNKWAVRRGLRALLEMQPGWKVVGEAATGHEAVSLVTQRRPDIAVLNIHMRLLNGVEAGRLISKASPRTRLLMLADYHTEEIIGRMLQAGVRGYLLKSDTEADLVSAVKALAEGRTYFTSAVATMAGKHLSQKSAGTLTVRESEIVQLLAEGNSNKQVASLLGISSRTVENHRAQNHAKAGLPFIQRLGAVRHSQWDDRAMNRSS